MIDSSSNPFGRRSMRMVLPLLLVLGACQTKRETLNLPWDAGSTQAFKAPMDKVRIACEDSLHAGYYTIREKESHSLEAGRYQILASQGVTAGNRYIRVHLENKPDQVVVWIVVSSKVDTREAQSADTAIADDLLKKIAERVAK
jgi:hypothetical protein